MTQEKLPHRKELCLQSEICLYGQIFSLFARHGRALTGVSPEHAQIVGSV